MTGVQKTKIIEKPNQTEPTQTEPNWAIFQALQFG